MLSKKRKVDSEARIFNKKWTYDYFFVEYNEKACCLICRTTVSVFKEYNVQRHYNSKHKEEYSKLQDSSRTKEINKMKISLTKQQTYFHKISNKNESLIRAGYKVAYLIARTGKPFTEGEFLKQCVQEIIEEILPENKHLISGLSLSARTITRRIEHIGIDLFETLKKQANTFQYFSIALDESSDINDTAQLIIFIRGINSKFEVCEELAALCSMKGTTTSADIFVHVEQTIESLGLNWKNLNGITTDGARNMCGHKTGVAVCVRNRVIDSGGEIPFIFHCIIHQQALCMKILKWKSVMDVVISIINLIRRHSLNHRQFQEFLAEIEAEYGDVFYHTDIRWLSTGNVLKRFFYLRDAIDIFLVEKGKRRMELLDPEWLLDLAFLIDITSLMNELNLKLQGKDKLVHECFSDIKSFEMKLRLIKTNILKKKFHNLPFCSIILENNPYLILHKFGDYIDMLQNEFETRFSDFHKHSDKFKLFQNPFSVDINDVPDYLEMEIIDLQTNDTLKASFILKGLGEFYATLPNETFTSLKKFAASMITLFASTYICEQTFSKMKYIKNKFRTQLTDEHLHSILRSSTSSFKPNYKSLMTNMKKYQSSH